MCEAKFIKKLYLLKILFTVNPITFLLITGKLNFGKNENPKKP